MSIGNSPEDATKSETQPDVPAAQPDGPSVGEALKQARIEAGLSVEQVSAATRVRTQIVQGIERDDFSRCGGDVYARGHIRTLARAVGTDPEPLLERYAAAHEDDGPVTPSAPLFEAERIRKAEPSRPNWTAAMVAAIVVVVGFVGFTLVGGDDKDAKSEAREATSAVGNGPTKKPGPDKTVVPTPEATESAVAAAPQDKVTVVVDAADGRSWISAKDHNGRTLFDGPLEKGQKKTFQDKEKIDLVLGDAGAIKLYVNGKEIEDTFRPGQVERLSYTKGDPQAG